jgi:hypothetical protein
MTLYGAWIAHHLKIFGCPAVENGALVVLYRAGIADLALARQALDRGEVVVAILPSVEFAKDFGVTIEPKTIDFPQVLRSHFAGSKPWRRVRTLHSYMRFKSNEGTSVVSDHDGGVVWFRRSPGGSGQLLFLGTDLASDLLRYRQGDPAKEKNRPTEPKWGIPGERPNYLFDAQLAGEDLNERPADWWCETLADALTRLCGIERRPMLPNAAPGAIVITGDDDQAGLAQYEQQREALGSLPITYFLHPLTKHDRASLERLKPGRRVELGLHPDALDNPHRYSEIFSEQAKWFSRLTGVEARTVRNHGFLNDGYWAHAKSWIDHGVTGSSNLPGLDGQILNGSLLPARLLLEDKLTEHWSILTAVGDGVVFVHGWDDHQSAECIYRLANDIRESGIPGIIVLNLHPENIEKTRGMHEAARRIAESGFVAWTLGECLDWFRSRDPTSALAEPSTNLPSVRLVQRARRSVSGLVKNWLVDLIGRRANGGGRG